MRIVELVLVAIGLSMDAFAVSICKGLSVQKLRPRQYLLVGLWFGGLQALMPAIGYLLGGAFESYISSFDHWVAFGLLCLIGGKMVKDGCAKDCDAPDSSFAWKALAVLAIATSIDALAVGITFALLPDVNIVLAVTLIGGITFAMSALGLRVGNLFGAKYKSKAELVGGVILLLIGAKILLDHLGLLGAQAT